MVEKIDEQQDVRHEPDDVNVRVIWLSGVVLLLVVVGALLLVSGMKYLMAGRVVEPQVSAVPYEDLPATMPRLEANQEVQLQQLRAWERARLSEYGWVDREASIAHIPIDRAIDIITHDGMPQMPTDGTDGN